MADLTPRTWGTAALWFVAAVVILVLGAWWSGVLEWPPAPSPEAQEEMQLDTPPAESQESGQSELD